MGVAFTFKAETKTRVMEVASDFARDLRQTAGYRASIVGVVRSNAAWLAIVDVCGRPSFKVAKIAKKHGAI